VSRQEVKQFILLLTQYNNDTEPLPAQSELHSEEYQTKLVPFSGDQLEGKYHRGPGPPYSTPAPPHPTRDLNWQATWDQSHGIYRWRNRDNHSEFQYLPPQLVLERLFKETDERYPETPPGSDTESEQEFQDPDSPEPIQVDTQETETENPDPIKPLGYNPLSVATEPADSPIPYLLRTPIHETPSTGPVQLTRQRTLESQNSSNNTEPFQQQPLQIQVHPFTGLLTALSGPLPQNILGNIFGFAFGNPNYINMAGAGGAAPQQPVAGVTMAQL